MAAFAPLDGKEREHGPDHATMTIDPPTTTAWELIIDAAGRAGLDAAFRANVLKTGEEQR